MSDDDQGRLQDYGVDAGVPPVEDDEPTCERCGTELEDGERGVRVGQSRAEYETNVTDIYRGRGERDLCEDCVDLERYLRGRHAELTNNVSVTGAVAVFCSCQGDDEVDVQPLRPAEPVADRECSRCGSREVVVEELPPDAPEAPEEVGE